MRPKRYTGIREGPQLPDIADGRCYRFSVPTRTKRLMSKTLSKSKAIYTYMEAYDMRANRGGIGDIYVCTSCNGWHLTRSTPNTREEARSTYRKRRIAEHEQQRRDAQDRVNKYGPPPKPEYLTREELHRRWGWTR